MLEKRLLVEEILRLRQKIKCENNLIDVMAIPVTVPSSSTGGTSVTLSTESKEMKDISNSQNNLLCDNDLSLTDHLKLTSEAASEIVEGAISTISNPSVEILSTNHEIQTMLPVYEQSQNTLLPPQDPHRNTDRSSSNSCIRDRSRSSSTESNPLNVRSSSPSSFTTFTTDDTSHFTGPMSDPISAVQGWIQNKRNLPFQAPSLASISSVFHKLGTGINKDNVNTASERSPEKAILTTPIATVTLDELDVSTNKSLDSIQSQDVILETDEKSHVLTDNSNTVGPTIDKVNEDDKILKNSFTPLRCLRCCGTVEGPKYSTCICAVPTLIESSGVETTQNRSRTSSISVLPMFGVGYSLFGRTRTVSNDISDTTQKACHNDNNNHEMMSLSKNQTKGNVLNDCDQKEELKDVAM